jgi:maltose 6'-phosphate phosphatase
MNWCQEIPLPPISGGRGFTVNAAGGKKMKAKLLALVLIIGLGLTALGFPLPQKAVANNVNFKILTINLLFSEIHDRTLRLTRIADYVKSTWGSASTTPVDVLFLQEVVGGFLVGTDNSAKDLQTLLANRGLTYYLDYHLEESVPGLFTQGIAILSRFPMIASQFMVLSNVEVVNFLGFSVTLPRIVLMNGIAIPGYGRINIYNTHLCSECAASGRAQQIGALLNFIQSVEQSVPPGNQIFLGGDFNLDLNDVTQRPGYQTVLSNGFIDTYNAIHHVGFTCCDPNSGGGCCTYALPGNPYAFDPTTGQKELPARLDYIFSRGKGMRVLDSEVVFNNGDWVSDHSGLVSEIELRQGEDLTGVLNLLLD